jgi:hypothetical protein
MPWLRLWDDALDCPKVHRLKPELFRAWIFLLLAAKRHGDEGLLPALDTIAFWMRADVSEVQEWAEGLAGVGMLDKTDSGYLIHDWDHWQQPPDRTVAQRMRRYRETRKKGSGTSKETGGEKEESRAEDVTRNVTPSVTDRNATVTLRRNAAVTPPPPDSASPRDPEADRVCNLAAEIGGDIGWATWAENRLRMKDTPKAIEYALNEAVNAKVISTSFCGKVLARIAREGMPMSHPARNGKAAPGATNLPAVVPEAEIARLDAELKKRPRITPEEFERRRGNVVG